MNDTPGDTQEVRSERVTVTVTPSEKRAVKAVAAAREIEESTLLRTTPLADVIEEHRKIRELVSPEAA